MKRATAIVLAGGRSSRMGSPKALLLFEGEPLVSHIVHLLHDHFAEVVVVAAPGQELPSLPVKLVRDEVPYQGPVGGIWYGLRAASRDLCFVTSCDSAFLNAELISFLVSQAADHDVVVPFWQGRLQPLHAVYRRSVLPTLEAQLARGELRPVYLFDKVRTLTIGEEEIRRVDPQGSSFFNMNSPEDYMEAQQRWRARAGGRSAGQSDDPVHCTVELFGVAQLLAKTRQVSLTLPPGAAFPQVFAALAEKVPVLIGRVISPDRTRLVEGYACNVNGLEFVRTPDATVTPGDTIVILSADAGG